MLGFRRAEMNDIPDIMRVVSEARAFMRALGIDQWQDGYPERNVLERDVELRQLYVFAEDAPGPGAPGSVAAVAALTPLPEPIYDALEGAWLTAGPALTIHRMALDDAHRGGGIASLLIENAARLARDLGLSSLRVDTHPGNRAMRRFLDKQAFAYCGTVRYPVRVGNPLRVAYERAL